jgi:hypothetical protein
MTKRHPAEEPEHSQWVAKCREGAERCRTNAAESEGWLETEAWLELASAWTDLAKTFDSEERPRLLN